MVLPAGFRDTVALRVHPKQAYRDMYQKSPLHTQVGFTGLDTFVRFQSQPRSFQDWMVLGDDAASQGEDDRAFDYYQCALGVVDYKNHRYQAVEVLHVLGEFAGALERYEESAEYYERALLMLKSIPELDYDNLPDHKPGDHQWDTATLNLEIGDVYMTWHRETNGETTQPGDIIDTNVLKAKEFYQKGLELLSAASTDPPRPEWLEASVSGLRELARVTVIQAQHANINIRPDQARKYYEEAVTSLSQAVDLEYKRERENNIELARLEYERASCLTDWVEMDSSVLYDIKHPQAIAAEMALDYAMDYVEQDLLPSKIDLGGKPLLRIGMEQYQLLLNCQKLASRQGRTQRAEEIGDLIEAHFILGPIQRKVQASQFDPTRASEWTPPTGDTGPNMSDWGRPMGSGFEGDEMDGDEEFV